MLRWVARRATDTKIEVPFDPFVRRSHWAITRRYRNIKAVGIAGAWLESNVEIRRTVDRPTSLVDRQSDVWHLLNGEDHRRVEPVRGVVDCAPAFGQFRGVELV